MLAETLEERILFTATPAVTVTAPAATMYGQSTTVQLGFSNTGTTTGYGPFMIVGVKTLDSSGQANGLSVASTGAVTYGGAALNYTVATLNDAANGGQGIAIPGAVTNSGQQEYLLSTELTAAPGSPAYTNGDTVVFITLPFGSDTPTQNLASPATTPINLTVGMSSNLAAQTPSGSSAQTTLTDPLLEPLSVTAVGGFQYGTSATGNGTIIGDGSGNVTDGSLGADSTTTINPELADLTKVFSGPENETATGPDFEQSYTIQILVADGQNLSDFHIYDTLPDDIQYVSLGAVTVNGATTTNYTLTSAPSTSATGGTLDLVLNSTVNGTATLASDTSYDATVTINFYVPDVNTVSSTTVLDPTSGAPQEIFNQPYGYATWDAPNTSPNTTGVPVAHDVRVGFNTPATGAGSVAWDPVSSDTAYVADASVTPAADGSTNLEDFFAKSIAIQKTFDDTSGSGLTSDLNAYTGEDVTFNLAFQVSDYFAYNQLVITDTLSDGLTFNAGDGITLNFQGTASNGTQFTLTNVALSNAVHTEYVVTNNSATVQNTTITINVSQVMEDSANPAISDGVVLGGYVNASTGAVSAANGNGGSTGTISYHATVAQDYLFAADYPSGQAQLVPRDTVNNQAALAGNVLQWQSADTFGSPEAQGDSTVDVVLTISPDTVSKIVYAIDGNTDLSTYQDSSGTYNITPGDTITYQITFTTPAGDTDFLNLTDYLPLPIFDATQMSTTFQNATLSSGMAPPAVNTASFGYTASPLTGTLPTITTSAATNSITFDIGTYHNQSASPEAVVILFTVQVLNTPFADGLYLTNQVISSEGEAQSAQHTVAQTTNIVQVRLDEPNLVIYKAAVATTEATQNTIADGLTLDPATGTTDFSAAAVDSQTDVSNIGALNFTSGTLPEAGDTVRFVVLLENTGRANAYDVSFTDTLPADYQNISNVQVFLGNGLATAATYTTTITGLGAGQILTFTMTGGSLAAGATSTGVATNNGTNTLMVFFDVTLVSTVQAAAVITNTATLTAYANKTGGTNFLTTPLTDTAIVDVASPTFAKSELGAGIGTDDNTNGDTSVVIGEEVTYQLTVTLPTGVLAGMTITDTLASGLAFDNLYSVTLNGVTAANTLGTQVTSGGSTAAAIQNGTAGNFSYSIGTGTGGGNVIVFTLGNLTNATGSAKSVTLVYDAVVLNVAGNYPASQTGTVALGNSAVLGYSSTPSPTGSAVNHTLSASSVNVNVGSTLALQKLVSTSNDFSGNLQSVTGLQAGQTVWYQVTLTEASGFTAAGAILNDPLPAALSSPTIFSQTLNGVAITDFTITGSPGAWVLSNASGMTFNPTDVVKIVLSSSISSTVNPTNVIANTATETWSSLPSGMGVTPISSFDTHSTAGSYSATSTANVSILAVGTTKSYFSSTDGTLTTNGDVELGETVTYALAVSLPAGTTLAGFTLSDIVPAGMSYASYSIVSTSGAASTNAAGTDLLAGRALNQTVTVTSLSATVGSDGTAVTFTFGQMVVSGANNTFLVLLSLNVDATASGSLVNQAKYATSAALLSSSPTLTNTVTELVVAPHVTVSKTVSDANPTLGEVLTYTVTLTSNGVGDAINTLLSDSLTFGGGFVAGNLTLLNVVSVVASSPLVHTDQAAAVTNGGAGLSGEFDLLGTGSIAGGSTVVITYTAQVTTAPATIGVAMPNAASATYASSNGTGATHSTTNTATASVTVPNGPDLVVTKTSSIDTIGLNTPFTYTITVTNVGTNDATGVTVVDTMPLDLSFVSADQGGTYNSATRQVTWVLPTALLAGGLSTDLLHITATVPSGSIVMGKLTNSVTVSDANFVADGPEAYLLDNSASVTNSVFGFTFNSNQDFANADPLSDDLRPGLGFAYALRVLPPQTFQLPLLSVAPLYSGSADPGTTLVINIYNTLGNPVGYETVVADAGGNWVASFPSTVLHDYPQSVTITEQPSEEGDSGFNLRTYFSPAINSSHFFSQPLSIIGVMAQTPTRIVQDMYNAAAHPISFDVEKHSYEFISSQSTAAGY